MYVPCVSLLTVYCESRGTQFLVEELAPSVLPPELELLGIDHVMQPKRLKWILPSLKAQNLKKSFSITKSTAQLFLWDTV